MSSPLQVSSLNQISWEILTTTSYSAISYVLIVIYAGSDIDMAAMLKLSV